MDEGSVVEAKRFDIDAFVRRYDNDAIDEDGEVGRCRDRICELARPYCGDLASCGGFMLWPLRAGMGEVCARGVDSVLHRLADCLCSSGRIKI